jgi:hypothetical protein
MMTNTTTTTSEQPPMVTLANGVEVLRASVQFAWVMRERGFDFEMVGNRLAVSPASRLTPVLRNHVREHWHGLVAITRLDACIDNARCA